MPPVRDYSVPGVEGGSHSLRNPLSGRFVLSSFIVGLFGVLAARPLVAQPPTLSAVVERAGQYVLRYAHEFAGIVAEESYEQDARGTLQYGGRGRFFPMAEFRHRELKSDVLLVKLSDTEGWIQFRDVFEVDGRAVRDRIDRLSKLFLDPSPSALKRADAIVKESSRYNIGSVTRTINVPVLALAVLMPDNRPRFQFSSGDASDGPHANNADEWVVHYQEVRPETLIRTDGNRDLFVHGRFWIDPSSGGIRKSELLAEDVGVTGRIEVTYREEPSLGVQVPAEMRESYRMRGSGASVEGRATYSNFRRFQVTVEEKIR